MLVKPMSPEIELRIGWPAVIRTWASRPGCRSCAWLSDPVELGAKVALRIRHELDGDDLDVAIRSVARTDALGEPWKSRLRTRDLIERLAQIGFSDIFHLTPAAAQARYFAGRRDSLRAPALEQLIAATV
jgi:hypothetical protein